MLWWGICGPHPSSLSCSSFFVGAYASKFWDSMVHARLCSEFIFLLVAMGWETLFKYLKFGPKLFEVDHLDGMESLLLRGYSEIIGPVARFVQADSLWLVSVLGHLRLFLYYRVISSFRIVFWFLCFFAFYCLFFAHHRDTCILIIIFS